MKELKGYIPDIRFPQIITLSDGTRDQVHPGQILSTPELALQAEMLEDQYGKWEKLLEQKLELLEHFDEIQEILKK